MQCAVRTLRIASSRPRAALALCGLLLLTTGCTTTVEQSPAGAAETRPVVAARKAAWEVLTTGQVRGSVVRFREEQGAQRQIYVVRNEHGQDLGFVDSLGRAWRRRPFQEEAELLGTGGLLSGALLVLGRSEDPSPTLHPLSTLDPETGTATEPVSLNSGSGRPR